MVQGGQKFQEVHETLIYRAYGLIRQRDKAEGSGGRMAQCWAIFTIFQWK